MAFDEIALLHEAYNKIQDRYPGLILDSFGVVTDVVAHRNFWKPPTVRTMLLAESHVYTADSENIFLVDYPAELRQYSIPRRFVRLVYCLGYGEQLLAPHVKNNSGTWQYWKIFAACSSDTPDIDFRPVLKNTSESDRKRVLDKFSILRKLRDKGAWLVDCSSVALYGRVMKRSSKQKRDILRICWESYIQRLLENVKPEHIIVVGKRVGRIVEADLNRMEIPNTIQPQPQARLSSEKQAEVLRTYQRISSRKHLQLLY